MGDNPPTSHDTRTPPTYTRKLTVPSITLDNKAFSQLILILQKAHSAPSFHLAAHQDELDFTDVRFLDNQNWPVTPGNLTFDTGFRIPTIRGTISTPDHFGFSSITLQHDDPDWVSARSAELQRFLAEHRNWHNLFHNLRYVIPQGVAFAYLLINWLLPYSEQPDSTLLRVLIVFGSVYLTMALYFILLPKVFPFFLLEPEHHSSYTRLRTVFKLLIPAVFTTLLAQAIGTAFS